MGRKIPGKKHRGVKDPYDQKARREESLKTKINAPPNNIDYQEVPKSLEIIIKLKEMTKNGLLYKKRKRRRKNQLLNMADVMMKETKLPGMIRPDNPIPNVVQRPGEKPQHFLHRIDVLANDLKREARYEEYFGVEIKKNPETGKIEEIVKNPKKKAGALSQYHLEGKEKTKPKKDNKGENKKNWSQKKREKLKKRKEMRLESKLKDFESFKDKVEFGEVVDKPPKISRTSRPGKKDLLLKSVIESKEKDQSKVEVERKEIQRMLAVKAYRKLKEMKLLQKVS